MIRVEEVGSKKQLGEFIDFPHFLYKDDPNYVPELFIAQRDLLTPGKHPFHEHAALKLFLAYRNDRPAGRIAAILNRNHNQFNRTTDGFFGFFDAVEDEATASALFEKAEAWLRAQGATTMIGPVNPSTNEPCGQLIEGFDMPPAAMMVYNKPYYRRLTEAAGFAKKVDLLAYDLPINEVSDRSVRLRESLIKRLAHKGIVIRTINMKRFREDVAKIREVYNTAWDSNLGFVPMTFSEFTYLAKDLKLILDPGLCLLAEHGDKLVGFALAIPDINQALVRARRGRLLPFGVFKILLALKKINNVRVLALGVTEPYRKMGIEACFYASLINRAVERKARGGERASWILEHNELMKKGIESINGKVYKQYRIYEKELS